VKQLLEQQQKNIGQVAGCWKGRSVPPSKRTH